MLEQLSQAWQATSQLEIVSVAFGLAYVLLAARENSWCWLCAIFGPGTAIVLFWQGLLKMESALNVYYLLMAIYGWWKWRGGSAPSGAALKISSWGIKQHTICWLSIAVLSLLSGYYLSRYTDAALPYLDSFTTWSAIITTWMVTRKILENWLYWLVINSASIYLFLEKEFYLYAALYVIYIVVAIYGYFEWRKHYKHARTSA